MASPLGNPDNQPVGAASDSSVVDVNWNPDVVFSKSTTNGTQNIDLGMNATPMTKTE